MAKLFPVGQHDSMVTHYGLARREDLAARMDPADVTPDNWWHWKTACGHEIVGHVEDRLPVNCQRCLAGLEKARKTVADLRARFGDGID